MMATTIERLDDELRRLQAEVGNIERMPPTIAERFAKAEAELRQAEQLYRDRGLNVSAGHPLEAAHLQRQTVAGMCMVVGGDKLLKVERARIEAMGEGMTAADKTQRIVNIMDANQIRSFCTTAAELLAQVGEYASIEPAKHKPEDDALVRQLRVSVGALASALMEVARMTPPPMPAMPAVQPRSPNVGALS